MTKKFSIKKLVAGVLAAAMVVTALPVSGLNVKAADEATTVTVWRAYNPNNSDHLYTTNKAEYDAAVARGESGEGEAWIAPSKSNTPIYRVYNTVSGEHMLCGKSEAEGIAATVPGWNNEGFQGMYSDDNKGVPIYRVFNPNATNAGSHHYAGYAEAAGLVALGWVWDNNGEPMFYGVDNKEVAKLALDKVESANGQKRTALIAYFNKPVGNLQPGDIQIRRVDTNELNTVEKVVMSSDQMTATLQLVGFGTEDAQPLAANTDYRMIITSNGETAEKVFSIPDTEAGLTVVATDETKATITTAAGKFFVPSDMVVDYEEILGRTVTVEFDKDMTLSRLNVKDEKVVYGSFVVSNGSGADDGLLVDPVSGAKYDDQESVAGGKSDLLPTCMIWRTDSGTGYGYPDFDDFTDKEDAFAYAKLVLNTNGTVRAMVTCPAWSNAAFVDEGNVLVSKVVGDTVYGGTTPIDFKDFTIVKNGKKIALKDVAEGDVVFFNTNVKYAEVYNNKKTGALEAVYDGRFTFGGTTYNVAAPKTYPGAIAYKTRYIKKDGGLTDVDNDYLTALKKAGKDVTVYFNRAGQPVYLTGETAETVSSNVTIVLTDNVKLYKQSLAEYIRVKGFDGKTTKTYDIDVSGLDTITTTSKLYRKGYKPVLVTASADEKKKAKDASDAPDAQKHGSFVIAASGSGIVAFDPDTGVGTIVQNDCNSPANVKVSDIMAIDDNHDDGIFDKKSVWTLTLDDENNVTGLTVAQGENDKNAYKSDTVFKGGLSTVETQLESKYQIASSTPIFIYDDDADTVKVAPYSSFTSATDKGKANKVHVYSEDGKNVSLVVIESGALDTDSTGETTVEAVVSEVEYSADSDKKMVKLSLVTGDEAKPVTYTVFGKDLKTSDTVKVGKIVTAKIAADKKTINNIEVVADNNENAVLAVTDVAKTEFTLYDYNHEEHAGLALATSVTPTLVKITDTGAVEKINFAELATLSRTNKVNYSMLTAKYADTIVVTQNKGGSVAYAEYLAAKKDVDKWLTAPHLKDAIGDIDEAALGKGASEHLTVTEITTWLKTDANVKAKVVAAYNAATENTKITSANVTVTAVDGNQTAAVNGNNGTYNVKVTISVGGYEAFATVDNGVIVTSTP